MDRLLGEARFGNFWLQQSAVAEMVRDSLFYAGENLRLYDLHAWVIMPDHIHLLITPQVPIPQITKSVKNYTALHCNRILSRSGRFWQEETFDRSVRNRSEFRKIAAYIENNPLKAGLVTSSEVYRWWGDAT